jgi:hypothetical protein
MAFSFPWLRCGVVAGLTAFISPLLTTSVLAQIISVSERQDYIGQCRRVVNPITEVFNTSRIGNRVNRVGSLNINTDVVLTGVLADGVAQVYLPINNNSIQLLGWVNSNHLGPCGGGTGTGGIEGLSVCYRADEELIARSQPSSSAANVGRFRVGDVARPTTDPPTEQITADGRIWTLVETYNGTGWIARTGPNQMGSSVTWLSADQCLF